MSPSEAETQRMSAFGVMKYFAASSGSPAPKRGPAKLGARNSFPSCAVPCSSRIALSISPPGPQRGVPSLRKGGGLVDAPGRGLVGAKGEYPFVCPICRHEGDEREPSTIMV